MKSSIACPLAAPLLAAASLAFIACGSDPSSSSAGGSGGASAASGSSASGSSGSASTSGSSTSSSGGAGAPLELIIEPSDHGQALSEAMNAAKSSLHVTMYLMNDPQYINALIGRHQAGVDVKVILNKTFPTGGTGNDTVFSQLQAAGVGVVWASAAFTLTHEKCVIIDGSVAWIMTMNMQKSSPTNREYLVLDHAAADVAEAEAIFEADYAGKPITPSGPLLVAPVNARATMLTALQGAKKTIDLEGEELSDYKIVDALSAAQKAGVTVRVVLANTTPAASQVTAETQLKAASVQLRTLASPYVHAKAFVVDGAQVYIGSENFTTGSLQYNRELGLMTSDASIVGKVAETIAADFAAGKAL